MLELIIIVALACYGSKVTWQEGMIFQNLKQKLDDWIEFRYCMRYPKKSFFHLIRKPLYACPACMPSIWGSIAYWAMNYCTEHIVISIILWPFSIFAMSAVAWLLMYQFPFDD